MKGFLLSELQFNRLYSLSGKKCLSCWKLSWYRLISDPGKTFTHFWPLIAKCQMPLSASGYRSNTDSFSQTVSHSPITFKESELFLTNINPEYDQSISKIVISGKKPFNKSLSYSNLRPSCHSFWSLKIEKHNIVLSEASRILMYSSN